jgi:hypothetical protein
VQFLDWPHFEPPILARVCACSFCSKHGAAWTSNPRGRFFLSIADEQFASFYRFGTRTADFHLCRNCGVVPIVTCRLAGIRYAVINVRTFEDLDRAQLTELATSFEGERTHTRLERRRSRWTPEGEGIPSVAF